jgi:FMN-dependent NADH-azoreductase
MSILLRVDSSPRITNSHSRKLADILQTQWQKKHPKGLIVVRDIISKPIPHLSNDTISAFYTPVEKLTTQAKDALKLSDELIAEIKSADALLISAPMYNFSVPSSLKAWIDQIVRINSTFSFDGEGFKGLLKNKKLYLCLSYGGNDYSSKMQSFDFTKPYLEKLFSFIGIDNSSCFLLEGSSSKDKEALGEKIKSLEIKMTEVIE